MIKQTLEYVDIDEERTTRTLYFNLTQFEVEGEMELEVIQARFQKFQDEVIGDNPNAPLRPMTDPEKREILGMIKILVKHSYGVKEGKRIRKTQEIWDDFVETGAFSAFIYWLFQKPERANIFMSGIWPQGVDRPEEARPDLKIVTGEIDDSVDEEQKDETTPSIEGSVLPPGAVREEEVKDNLWDYGKEELLNMSDGEFAAVMNKFSEGKNVPAQLLVIGRQRSSRESTE